MVTDTPDDDDLLLGLLEDEGFGLADLSAAITNTLGPTARVDRAPAPAGAPQRRFWIQEQVEAESGLNTLSCLIPLPGGTTDQALTQAVETLITRHEVLRTHFVERDGTVMETVEPSIPTPSLPRISRDPTRPPEDDPALRRVVAPPFALDRTPLWRLALTTDGADGEALLLVCHHAIVDWVGATLLARDLLALLAGTPPPPPTLTQADVAHWARGPARAAQVARARTYWRDRLADLGPPLVLVAAKGQGEAGRTSPQPPDLHPITLDAERADALRAFAARQGTTLFAVVLAAQATVLARFTLAEEVAIGTAVANRSAPGTDCVVGCLTDLLPLRCDLSGRPSLPALVRRLHGHLAEDFAQDALGFADIASLAPPDRRATGAPLFESLFNLLGASGQDEGLVHPLPPTMARADLALELVDGGSGGRLAGRLEVRADLVAPEVGAALAAALSYLLTHLPHLADRPIDTLPLTGPAHPHGLLARLHPPMPPAPTASLVDRIERAARSRPDAQAVLDGDRTLIFGALLDHSGA
ncbi:MAG: hypothetical protein K9H11_06015, partial [Rhodospirillum sp.]|nr:hypothetical protein [Rhodospirillum sp.]